MIEYYFDGGGPLGDDLILLSLILSANHPAKLKIVNPNYSTIDENQLFQEGRNRAWKQWKSIFQISDEQLIIECTQGTPEYTNYLRGFKLFSRYLQPENVTVFNNKYPVGRPNKPCIAICMTNGGQIKNQNLFNKINNSTDYPYNKYHSLDTYQHIFKLVTLAGYDAIVVDSQNISLEEKIYILNNLCDAAIVYEGGIAHLCHVLKIPVIILPDNTINHNPQVTHLDKKTYFLESVQELVDWSPNNLISKIKDLHNDQGNNKMFNTTINIDWGNYQILKNGIPDLIGEYGGLDNRSWFKWDFTKKYLGSNLTIGGY
jgi:hypothetical protein